MLLNDNVLNFHINTHRFPFLSNEVFIGVLSVFMMMLGFLLNELKDKPFEDPASVDREIDRIISLKRKLDVILVKYKNGDLSLVQTKKMLYYLFLCIKYYEEDYMGLISGNHIFKIRMVITASVLTAFSVLLQLFGIVSDSLITVLQVVILLIMICILLVCGLRVLTLKNVIKQYMRYRKAFDELYEQIVVG